jgi:hypothetical protein
MRRREFIKLISGAWRHGSREGGMKGDDYRIFGGIII